MCRIQYALALALLVASGGCDSAHGARVDAAPSGDEPDAFESQDADAPPLDAYPDAEVDVGPTCASGAKAYLDFSPREIGDTALSGNVLYVSAFEKADTGDISNSVILSVDLTTGAEAFSPVTTAGDAALVAVGDDIYASISAGGTVLRLHPGDTPATVITGRPSAGAVTADASYVYWSERATPGDPDVVKRRLLAGGSVQGVLTCNQAEQLFVVGTDLYCVPFTGSVLRVASDGSGQTTGFTTNGYPIVSTIVDGAELYFAGFDVYPALHRMPVPTGPIGMLYEGTAFGRFTGIAATSTFFYVTHMDQGIRRFRRTNLTDTLVATDVVVAGDPVIWNNQLYYSTASATDAHPHWLRYCAD